MNISHPVPSAIGSVDFAFLTPAEIKALSVKRIQNPLTFDTLLHPVPSGLYDPALGAWGDIMYVILNLECLNLSVNRFTAARHVTSTPSPALAMSATSTYRFRYITLHS
jgi:hypothetical protein